MNNRNNSVWGFILIGLGILFLLNQLHFLRPLGFIADLIWAAAFVVGGSLVYNAYTHDKALWKLITAYVMAAIGGLIALDAIFPRADDLGGAYVMFAIALPFLYVYFNDKEKWWALIPGGIMASIGLGLLASALLPVIPALMIMVGIYLMARQFGLGKAATEPATPARGPEADKPTV